MFCLNFVHFAFFASLYFCFGSLCSPPGRHLLSRLASMPIDFLYSSLGIHLRFSPEGVKPSGPWACSPRPSASTPAPPSRSALRRGPRPSSLGLGFPRSGLRLRGRRLRSPSRARWSPSASRPASRELEDLDFQSGFGFQSGPPDRRGAGVKEPFGFHSGFAERVSSPLGLEVGALEGSRALFAIERVFDAGFRSRVERALRLPRRLLGLVGFDAGVSELFGFHSGFSELCDFDSGFSELFGFQSGFSELFGFQAGFSEPFGLDSGFSSGASTPARSARLGAGTNSPLGFQSSLSSALRAGAGVDGSPRGVQAYDEVLRS